MTLRRWRRPSPWQPQDRFNGLSQAEFDTLARYNSEHARGIVHTGQWQERMAVLQARYGAADRERAQHEAAERQRQEGDG